MMATPLLVSERRGAQAAGLGILSALMPSCVRNRGGTHPGGLGVSPEPASRGVLVSHAGLINNNRWIARLHRPAIGVHKKTSLVAERGFTKCLKQ